MLVAQILLVRYSVTVSEREKPNLSVGCVLKSLLQVRNGLCSANLSCLSADKQTINVKIA